MWIDVPAPNSGNVSEFEAIEFRACGVEGVVITVASDCDGLTTDAGGDIGAYLCM